MDFWTFLSEEVYLFVISYEIDVLALNDLHMKFSDPSSIDQIFVLLSDIKVPVYLFFNGYQLVCQYSKPQPTIGGSVTPPLSLPPPPQPL